MQNPLLSKKRATQVTHGMTIVKKIATGSEIALLEHLRRFFSSHKNYICIYDFCCSIADIVHFLHPSHQIGSFQPLGHAFTLCRLLNRLFKHIFGLAVNIRKITVQLAADL